MKFLDLWRFWILKESNIKSSEPNQSVPSSKSDGELSGNVSSSSSSIWGRRKKKKKSALRITMEEYSCGSDSGFTSSPHNISNSHRNRPNRTLKEHGKERHTRFKEAQRFWENFGKSKIHRHKKCRSECHATSMMTGSRFRKHRSRHCQQCEKCQKCIPQSLSSQGYKYHPDCQTCSRCFIKVPNGSFSEIGNRILCDKCEEYIITGSLTPKNSNSSTATTVISRNSIDRNVGHGSRLSETSFFCDSATSVSDLYPLKTEDLCSLPNLSRNGTPRNSARRYRKKRTSQSNSDISDEEITIQSNIIPVCTSMHHLPGSRFDPENEDSIDSDGFYETGRRISSPVSRNGSLVLKNSFYSQQTSPILTRQRSLTASQIIRNRFQRRFDDTRRSSVELNKERSGGHSREISKDLSRSESMRLGAFISGYRAFRPGDFIDEEVLGEGFFASATKVYHKETGEVMVSKKLHKCDGEERDCFLKEVKVLRSIRHKNVLRFIGVIYKDTNINLITEYVECGTLKNHIKNSTEMNWANRISIARDISAGMEYLHNSNIIHRDLNSNNCLVKEDGSVVVADFGLARWSRPGEDQIVYKIDSDEVPNDSSHDSGDSSSGLGRPRSRQKRNRNKKLKCVGSPYWMAPEMLAGDDYDHRVDIFSFGIVLCEVIGRVDPDPDYLPRTTSFGLAVAQYYVQFALKTKCPQYFFAIAVICCEINPNMRPSFEELHSWFELLVRRLALSKLPVPPEVASVREEVWDRYGLDHLNSIDDLSEIEESSANITSCTEEGEDLSS